MIPYRFLAILLIPLFLIHSWAYIVNPTVVYAEEGKVTPRAPETVETEPSELPGEPAKGGVSWLWIIIGIAAIGGAAAAAGGGGGTSGGGTTGGGGGGTTGGATITW